MQQHEQLLYNGMQEIITMINEDTTSGEDRNFIPRDSEKWNKVRKIGEMINEIGNAFMHDGFGLMQEAHYAICDLANCQPGDLRSIEFCWDGIGEWRC